MYGFSTGEELYYVDMLVNVQSSKLTLSTSFDRAETSHQSQKESGLRNVKWPWSTGSDHQQIFTQYNWSSS